MFFFYAEADETETESERDNEELHKTIIIQKRAKSKQPATTKKRIKN
jgi:hypothetical protein